MIGIKWNSMVWKKMLFVLCIIFLTACLLTACASKETTTAIPVNSSTTVTVISTNSSTVATPIPYTKTIVHTNNVGNKSVATMALYMYVGQQLAMSFHSTQAPVMLKLVLPDNNALGYTNDVDNSPGFGKLLSGGYISASNGSFVYQSSENGFYTVVVESAYFVNSQAVETDCELDYEVR